MRSARFASSCMLIGVLACADPPNGIRPEVRDSAGVTIVENRAPAWTEADAWSVDSVPEVTIGVVEGSPEQQLFRVGGATVLDDGRIVILNEGTNELRFYDETGRYLSAIGGAGDGPGEFRSLDWFGRYGADSLVAYDGRHRRVSVFTLDGTFVRSFTVPRTESASPRPAGAFSDRTLFLRTNRVYNSSNAEAGTSQDSMALYRTFPDGVRRDTLGVFPSQTRVVVTTQTGFMVMGMPFTTSLITAVQRNRFYRNTGAGFEVAVHGMEGALERIVRLERAPRPVTDADIDRFREQTPSGEMPDAFRRMQEQMLDAMTFPAHRPEIGDLIVDREGNVWVRAYTAFDDEPDVWTVVDAEGRVLGEVPGLDGLDIYEISADWVLAGRTDELDVEHVELYRLRKGGT